MSVIVNGMDMPKNCYYCRFNYDTLCHAAQQSFFEHEKVNGRLIDCPLSPVIKHEKAKTYCEKWPSGCVMCELELCDGKEETAKLYCSAKMNLTLIVISDKLTTLRHLSKSIRTCQSLCRCNPFVMSGFTVRLSCLALTNNRKMSSLFKL